MGKQFNFTSKYTPDEVRMAVGQDCLLSSARGLFRIYRYKPDEARYLFMHVDVIAMPSSVYVKTVRLAEIVEIPFIDKLRSCPLYKLIL